MPTRQNKNWYPNFERKNQLLLQFCPKWSNFWYKWSWAYLAEKWRVDFLFFYFLRFYWTRKLPNRHFFGKICRFCQKSADSATFGSNKIAKKQKIKNLLVNSLLNIPKIIYTKNWTISGKIEGGVDFFARSWGINFFFAESAKKGVFHLKIGKFLAKFSKNFQFNKKCLITLCDKILGQMGHFLAFFGWKCPFLGHFLPYSANTKF